MTGKIKHTAPTLDGGQANEDDDDMKDPTLRCNGAAPKHHRTLKAIFYKIYIPTLPTTGTLLLTDQFFHKEMLFSTHKASRHDKLCNLQLLPRARMEWRTLPRKYIHIGDIFHTSSVDG